MNDQSQSESKDKTSELLEVLPFMSAFPFNDYKITLVEYGKNFISLGVSPILINEFGDTGTFNILNFSYADDDSNVVISIHLEDISWILEEAIRVKKMDSLRVQLDEALVSDDLIKKIKAAKAGKKFSKILNCDNIEGLNFGEIFSEFLKLNDTTLQYKTKLGLQKLSESIIKSVVFSEKQFKTVAAFLNFQIHYIKILLGIVIASKIY